MRKPRIRSSNMTLEMSNSMPNLRNEKEEENELSTIQDRKGKKLQSVSSDNLHWKHIQ